MKLLKYKQKNNWTCGPACLLVVLNYFGIRKDIPDLIKELKTTKKEGTDNANIIKLLKKYELKFIVKENSTLHDLKKYLKNYLVIVGFWIPFYKESHYSIVKKINKQRIYFHDTWFGYNHSYKIDYFLKNWWDEEVRGWLLAIKKC